MINFVSQNDVQCTKPKKMIGKNRFVGKKQQHIGMTCNNVVCKQMDVDCSQSATVSKQGGIGGVNHHLWGYALRLGLLCSAGRYAVKAFFFANLLKIRCVLLKCNEIKQNIARYKAGSLIYSPLYI